MRKQIKNKLTLRTREFLADISAPIQEASLILRESAYLHHFIFCYLWYRQIIMLLNNLSILLYQFLIMLVFGTQKNKLKIIKPRNNFLWIFTSVSIPYCVSLQHLLSHLPHHPCYLYITCNHHTYIFHKQNRTAAFKTCPAICNTHVLAGWITCNYVHRFKLCAIQPAYIP